MTELKEEEPKNICNIKKELTLQDKRDIKKEINRCYYEKNKEEILRKKREKYNTDEEFRKKHIAHVAYMKRINRIISH
jgi:hypothetical protein